MTAMMTGIDERVNDAVETDHRAVDAREATPPPPRGPAGIGRAIRAAAELLRLGGDPSRLAVLFLLRDGERNVGDLCGVLGVTQPLASHHLAHLRVAGIIEPERRGKHVFYALTDRGRRLVAAAESLVDRTD